MNLTSGQKNIVFVGVLTLAIFTITYIVLILIGLTPSQLQDVDQVVGDDRNIFQIVGDQQDIADTNLVPQKIEIPKIGVSSTIQIPNAIDVGTLDAALAKGAVYYPGSGTIQSGNMFLFGHSTNWQIVNNQAYKTFNDLDKLIQGDSIQISSGDATYVYKVTNVYRASEDDVRVDFNKGSRMLTISTCDSFGKKQDRWVVEAVFEKVS